MKLVTIKCNGATETHLPHQNGNYATLCGMDGDDEEAGVNQATVRTPKYAKVNCQDCWDIWSVARQFDATTFAFSARHDAPANQDTP